MKNNAKTKVDLVFNIYELTYVKVLNQEYINQIIEQNLFNFENVFVVINNVKNKIYVEEICQNLIKNKTIDDYFFVEEYLDKALSETSLSRKSISKLTHYIDWALVSILVCKSDFLLKWDADANLTSSVDWITPCIQELKKNKNFIVANPLWDKELKVREKESIFDSENFWYTQDFSDQIFLVKRVDFLKPIYEYFHIYSLRYPLAIFGSIFEMRVDSYMRCNNKIRLTYKKAVYTHPDNSGSPYPKRSIIETLTHYTYMLIILSYSLLTYPKKVKDIYRF